MSERVGTGACLRGCLMALLIAILVPLLLWLTAAPLIAQNDEVPQEYPYVFASYGMDIRVEADSSLHVQERVTYRFSGFGEWVGIYIPFEYGNIYNPRVLNEYGRPLPDELWELEWAEEGVTLWYNGEGSTGDSTVIYDYYSYGALNREGSLTGFEWSATPETHDAPINKSSVNIHLPGYVSSSDLELQARAYNYDGPVSAAQSDPETVYCLSWDMPPDAYYRFSCYWPSSMMSSDVAVTPLNSMEGKHWDFARFDTDIHVNPDASLNIRETQVANFYGSYHFLNRDLTLADASGYSGTTYGRVRITDIAVYDLEGNLYDESLWSVEKISGGKRVHLEFEAQDQQMGWIIEYRMSGAIIYYDDYDRLYFNSVSYDRDVPISASRTTVHLPNGVDMDQVETDMYVDQYYKPSYYDYGKDGDTLWWEAADVDAFSTYTIDVAFPKGVVSVPWQFGQTFKLIMLILAGLLVLACLVVMLRLWMKLGRDIGRTGTEMVRYDPPPGLKPAVMGMLLKEKPLLKDISATIVDLARRGFLNIFEEGSGSIFTHTSYGFIKRSDSTEGLSAYEKEVMDGLFESGDRVTESDLKNVFYAHVVPIQDGVTDTVLDQELFSAEPAVVKKRYTTGGLLVSIVSVAVFVLAYKWLYWDLGWFWIILPAIILSGIIIIIVGRAMPRRTAKGSQAYEHALGFKEYLATAERDEIASMTAENFQETLPYAMVLGVAEAWASKFSEIFTEPPEWFNGVGTFNTVYLASSLNGMYENLGSTLASAPSSSGGSGGGGFSGGFGGGFSGGGFGGGGSSAG